MLHTFPKGTILISILFVLLAVRVQGQSSDPHIHDSTVVIKKEVTVVKKVYVVADEPPPEVRKSIGISTGIHNQHHQNAFIEYDRFQRSDNHVTSEGYVNADKSLPASGTWLHLLADYQKDHLNYEIGVGISSYYVGLQYYRDDRRIDTTTNTVHDTTDTYFTIEDGDTVEIAIVESTDEEVIDTSYSFVLEYGSLTLTFLEVPLKFGYVIPIGKAFEIVPRTGVTLGFLIKRNGAVFDRNGDRLALSSQKVDQFTISCDTQIDVVYHVLDSWSVMVAPYYRFDFVAIHTGMYKSRIRSGGMGFQLGLKKNF